MRVRSLWLVLASLEAFAAAGPPTGSLENPLVTKAREKQELVTKLKRDIFKVDRAIGETEKLISKSRNAPYLPDLQFRLAELYVEKSRYVYYLQAETRPEGAKGSIVSPETKLLKQKAVQIYNRILREFPDFKDNDKVTFYLAHEQRELGEFDEMLKTLLELTRKYPASPLRLDAEQILGDYFFDKSDLVQAEKHYRAILEQPTSPVHDLARYKMGWIRINQDNHNEAVTFFEAVAASPVLPGVDPKRSLNVKREALLDLIYSYTKTRKPQGALNYFEKLSESRATYALALDKLSNRYFTGAQFEYAIPALRKLMEIQPDPELDYERVGKLYDSLKAAKGKVPPKPEDVRFMVRAAVNAKVDPALDESARKKQLQELEEMARDLATQLHLAAQKKNEREQYLDAAAAYEEYLALFRPKAHVATIMKNRADALFAAKEYVRAARQFEELARLVEKDAKELETALYGALLAHYSSLKPGEVQNLNAFEVADARQALKILGAAYLARYPKSEHATEVKFNIARAHWEDGEYEKAAEQFKAFALSHPEHKDASLAGELALDSLRQINDFKSIEVYGKAFLSSRLPGAFQQKVRDFLKTAKSEALGELALKSSQETGDVIEGLVKVADENRGAEVGEKALYGAFAAAREKRDLRKERELAARFAAEYPKSSFLADVLLTMARHSAESGRFQEAASWFEQVGQKMGGDSTALDGWLAGARLRIALGEYREAIRDLEAAADIAGARKAEVLALMAETRLKAKEPQKARALAEQALKLDKNNALAASIVAEVVAITSPNEKPDKLIAILTQIANGPEGGSDATARGLWYLGEVLYKAYRELPNDKVEEKVSALQQLEGVYTQAAQMGSPEWAVASLWRIGLGYQHIADVVEATPMPAGLSAAEVQQFRAAVKEQVGPLKQRAEEAFKLCVSRANQLDVFTAAVIGCRQKSEAAKSPIPPPPEPKPANVDELLKRAESSLDAASLEALGMAYLQARELNLAILALGRAVELEDQRASAHNALGFAMLLSGDSMGARAEYGKALDADPTSDKARANLAALRCRFKDVEGAKRELSLIKDTSALSGPDVDPEWRACR